MRILVLVLFSFISCSIGIHSDLNRYEPEALGGVILGFEAPGGHGDVSLGGNLLKEPVWGLSRITDGFIYITYQFMPYPYKLKMSYAPLISPGFSLGYIHRTSENHNILLSGNAEVNFLRNYGKEPYGFGLLFIAIRYYVLYPSGISRIGVDMGLRGAWWRAPF